ncbi:MAG: site-specific integrase [Candidatus Binatia bacterium]
MDRYLTWLAAERRLSPHTLAGYARDCAALAQFLERQGVAAPADVLPGHLVGFLEAEQRRGLSARSRARALAAVRGLFAFLVRDGRRTADPSRELRRPRLGRPLPKTLAQASVADLLDAASPDPLVQRDLAMIELIYAAGLRVSEVVSLTVTQVAGGRLPHRDRQGAQGARRAHRPRGASACSPTCATSGRSCSAVASARSCSSPAPGTP